MESGRVDGWLVELAEDSAQFRVLVLAEFNPRALRLEESLTC
jgi:hypothetical protein